MKKLLSRLLLIFVAVIGLAVVALVGYEIIYRFIISQRAKPNKEVLSSIPKKHYSDSFNAFDYPKNAEIVTFEHDFIKTWTVSKTWTVRVIVSPDVEIDIESPIPYLLEGNAEKRAKKNKADRENYPFSLTLASDKVVDLEPHQLANSNTPGWRVRFFNRQIEFSSIMDISYFDTPRGTVLVSYACFNCAAETYKTSEAFELVIRSITFK